MADKFSPIFNDVGKTCTNQQQQQQAHYSDDNNMDNYEQLLVSDHCADYAQLEKSDCEIYDVLSKPEIKA